MDVRKLQQFLAVSRSGSITAAARRLNIAQPALSHAIQALEDDLGAPLLVRHARGILLTEIGEVVAAQAEIISRELQRTRDIVSQRLASPSGRVRLGQPNMLAGGLAAALVQALKQRMGGITLEAVVCDARAGREGVASGHLDIALTYQAEADMEVSLRPLVVEDLALAQPPATTSGGSKLTFVELEALPVAVPPRGDPVREALDRAAAQAGVRLSIHAELDALEDLLAVVQRSGYSALLPRYAVQRAERAGLVASAGLTAPRVPLCLFMMTARERRHEPSVIAAREILVEIIEDFVRSGEWPGRFVGHLDSSANLVTIFTNTE